MWPALLVIAASAFLKNRANQQAIDRQKQLRQAMEGYQRTKAREVEAATNKLIDKQAPDARGAELAQIAAERQQSLRDTVGAAQAFDTGRTAGKASKDFDAAAEANANRIAERTRRAIEQLGTMGATAEQRQRFGIRYGRAAGEVDAGNRASDYVGRAYMSDIGNVRPNPYALMAGDIGMTVGSGMAAGAPGGARPGAGRAAIAETPGVGDAEWGLMDPGESSVRSRVARGFSVWGRS